MPTILRIRGYRIGFLGADGDEPPHVHVRKAGNAAKSWLVLVQLSKNAGFSRSELNKIHGLLTTHQPEFLRAGMNTLDDLRPVRVASTAGTLMVDFDDGRSAHLPLMWYPRLFRATRAQRDNYERVGGGFGVHWPDLDEDLSAKSLAPGKPSIEFIKQQRKQDLAA